MKKIAVCCALTFLLISCFLFKTVVVVAANDEVLDYKKVNGEIIITNCDEKVAGEFVIPSVIEGCPVTTIDDYAFSSCELLTSITIPDSVTSIGRSAFYYCDLLEKINIPKSVTVIGEGAFSYCDSLITITIPNSIKEIGDSAFESCENLLAVTIPEGVITIGREAFYDCKNLEKVSVGKDVSAIGAKAFGSCDKLKNINISDENQRFCTKDGILYSKDMTTLIQCPATQAGVVRIPEGVVTIKESAFVGCDKILSVILPEGVETIEAYAFENCSLTAIAIPNSVLVIGSRAFMFCSDLTMVVIPNQITAINEYTFAYCAALVSVGVPVNVTTIGEGAFHCCENLTQVNYAGNEERWKQVVCGRENTFFVEATKSYNYNIEEMNDIPALSSEGKSGVFPAILWMTIGGIVSLIGSVAVRSMSKKKNT